MEKEGEDIKNLVSGFKGSNIRVKALIIFIIIIGVLIILRFTYFVSDIISNPSDAKDAINNFIKEVLKNNENKTYELDNNISIIPLNNKTIEATSGGGSGSGGGGGGGSCTNDLGCSSAGLFCDGNNPYNCNLGGDGCLDKVNLIACTGNQVCVNGQGCVIPELTTLAFPGAEGFGAHASGGRGGRVIHVTNLNDSGLGSFRDAMTQSGSRIIVFDVGGVIELKSPLVVVNGNYTIAGQTAPGGITIVGYEFKASKWINAQTLGPTKNFIIRHIRTRGAYNSVTPSDSVDGLTIAGGSNFILDHVSIANGFDENLDAFNPTINNTIQWCTIEESAIWGQVGGYHDSGDHNLGFVQGGRYVDPELTFHHNLIANSAGRMVQIQAPGDGGADLRNNVIYNWGGTSANPYDGGVATKLLFKGYYNIINNSYIVGPSTTNTGRDFRESAVLLIDQNQTGSIIYPTNLTGNLWYKTLDPNTPPEPSMPNKISAEHYTNTPWPDAPYVTTESAQDSMNSVLNYAGAWPRDTTTRRTVNEVRTRTGGMGVRGPFERFPEKKGPTSAEYDTDRDGMPDSWEIAHGLNLNNVTDGNNIVPAGASLNDRHKGYTSVEYYLNELSDNIVGQSGQIYTISTNVLPNDSGAVIAEYGDYNWENFTRAGYNAPYWFGNIPFGNSEYNNGSIVVMKAKPRPGYAFDYWEGSPINGLTSTQISFPVTSDTIITAHFKKLENINIGVSISPIGSGNVAGSGYYSKGDIVTLAAYSNNGYKFKKWVGGHLDNAPNPVIQFQADSSYSIIAEFEAGGGGDVLIDDFNDKDNNSYLINSNGQTKKWNLGSGGVFYELNPGNFALTEKSQWYTLSLQLVDDSYTSDIPNGTTVLKFRIYNIGVKDATIKEDKRVPYMGYSLNNQLYFKFLSSGKTWDTPFLFHAYPFRYPILKPNESVIVEIPLCLIKDKYMNNQVKAGDKLFYLNFPYFGYSLLWDSRIAIDDAAFGRASAYPITAPNLPPVANAGIDQVTRDLDNNGKELVWLNGIKSYDSDGGLITKWSWSENGQQIANTYAPSVGLSVGVHNIILTVNDENNVTSSDNVVINVLGK